MSAEISIKKTDAAHLKVADRWCVIDLHISAVGSGQLEAVSEPNHRGSGMSLHLTTDVGRVSLPCIYCHRTQDLWGI